jgi:hypothetical protein
MVTGVAGIARCANAVNLDHVTHSSDFARWNLNFASTKCCGQQIPIGTWIGDSDERKPA